MKIGIPRALNFYNYYPFWLGFFNELGIEVVLSDKTTKEIISKGSRLVVTETCLPVKSYVGHVLNLLEKGITNIYVPSIQSIEHKIYNCSKIRGLPDLIRNIIKQDFNLIEPTLDMSDESNNFYNYLLNSVREFGFTDIEQIKQASKAGWQLMNNFNLMLKSGLPFNKALQNIRMGKVQLTKNESEHPINVAVISHGYNLYDDHASMRILNKFENLDVRTFTPENLSKEQKIAGLKTMNAELYWANEYEMTGAAGHFLAQANIDGVVTLNAFGCGPDSLMINRIQRMAKDLKKPLLSLTVDEHTGEAGFVTRLEAFTDMLFRRKRANIIKSIEEQMFDNDYDKEFEEVYLLEDALNIEI